MTARRSLRACRLEGDGVDHAVLGITRPCSRLLTRQHGCLGAIHRPNLFMRLSTMAKAAAADVWVVLDDAQFARRDYQHGARPGSFADDSRARRLTVPTHLPDGRSTVIREARVVDAALSRRRVADARSPRPRRAGGPRPSSVSTPPATGRLDASADGSLMVRGRVRRARRASSRRGSGRERQSPDHRGRGGGAADRRRPWGSAVDPPPGMVC
ncbi:WbqC family protein [Kitasatospora sp. NPDC002551]|uniref:WbqC family protein n=1 Tax=Kitasatospora sp. NPDC002551 TaxID=3154539 RepID=UPI003330905C